MLIVAGIAACENPQPPAACEAISQLTVNVGERATVTACFNDPNGDMLSYSVSSANTSVVTATISGTDITVSAVAPGNASVTVTATDPGGLQGQQSFQVMVPNRPPLARGTISTITIQVGQTVSVDASSYFTEPDGEALTYAASSSSPAVATVSAAGSTVSVAAVAKGTSTVTVTATDPGGLAATQTFESLVPNRSPEPVGTISDQTVEVGEQVTVDLSPYFDDPDGDTLTYMAMSSNSGVAGVSVSGATATVTAVAKGTTDVTITATDNEGLSATQFFGSVVPNRPPGADATIPDQTVRVGETATINLSSHFDDPDGDTLTYKATSSNSDVAGVSVSGLLGTITAVAKGTTDVTITAADNEGLSAAQTFLVTVPNRAPEAVGTMADLELALDSSAVVDLAEHFRDPDEDALTYSTASSNSAVADISVSGSTMRVASVAAGNATVTVTARDPEGLTAQQQTTLTVVSPDREVLVALYDATGGPNWANSGYWLTDAPLRDWHGVGTDASGRVVALHLDANQLTGPIPPHLANLTDVESLYLSANRLTGPIPTELANLSSLGHLRIDSNPGLADTIPSEYRKLSLERFWWFDTGLCSPDDSAFQAWLNSIDDHRGGPVCNRAPTAVGTISSQALLEGDRVSFGVEDFFTDPDGDDLEYTAESSRSSVVTALTSGSIVTLSAVSAGTATVTVVARDPDGLTAQQQAIVTVTPNRDPLVALVADSTVQAGSTFDIAVTLDMREARHDPGAVAIEIMFDSALVQVDANQNVTATHYWASVQWPTSYRIVVSAPGGVGTQTTLATRIPFRAKGSQGSRIDLKVRIVQVIAAHSYLDISHLIHTRGTSIRIRQ